MHKLIEGARRSQGEGWDGGGVDGRLRTTAKDPRVGAWSSITRNVAAQAVVI